MLAIKIRAQDGRIGLRGLPAERHRRLHLGLLHAASDGYVEVAAGRRPPGGKLALTSRRDRDAFLPGGASGQIGWLEDLLAHAARQIAAGKEVCVAPAVRRERAATKRAVSHTRWLWLDVDGADGLPALRALLRRRPAHLVIESAGSGGAHAYWRLEAPLQAGADERLAWLTGEGSDDAIERAHERIVYALGYRWQQGRPIATVADPSCRDRSRVMRLAGTINGKTGAHARIIWADLALRPWTLRALIADLPAPPAPRRSPRRAATASTHRDPYKRIAPAEYFNRLAGIEVPDHGLVSCPNPAHSDRTPSCHVGSSPEEGWHCFGCDVGAGAIYDLASLLLGGPTGRWLRGSQFRQARDLVRRTFGEP
ncbi:MAG TPA: hypothetical protein VG474_15110 [Solirubrobacteraceae bacterium]|nr:hypothetical protein [Solirubrobacteraceae bacterium]